MKRYHSQQSDRVRTRRAKISERFGFFHFNHNKRHPLDCGKPGCTRCHPEPRGHPRKRA